MYHNEIYDDVNEALPMLLRKLEKEGEEVGSRAGRTKELTHIGITLRHPWRREVLVPHRKPSIAAQIAETMWVLSGSDNVGWLSNYLPRAMDFSDDGFTWRAGYGARLRSWSRRDGEATPIDQLRFVVDLLRQDPSSRRAVMSIWDPVTDTQPGKDIPCNDWLSFSSRLGKLDLHVAIRSNDIIWGWSGINAFEWSALLEVVAGLLGMHVGSLHFSTTSLHIYDHHWVKAEKIVRDSSRKDSYVWDSPRFDASFFGRDFDAFDEAVHRWFEIEKIIRNGEDASDLVDAFPEPMMQSWLRVLQWWWTGDRDYMQPLVDTALEAATFSSIQPPDRDIVELKADGKVVKTIRVPSASPHDTFIFEVTELHNQKHAAYGDSWKRRGEMLGIMANIARKIDRLSGGETDDETSADTAIDLMVYLAKYRTWLADNGLGSEGTQMSLQWSDTPDRANELLRELDQKLYVELATEKINPTALGQYLSIQFDRLEELVRKDDKTRYELVETMMEDAYRLAHKLWRLEQHADEYQGADVD